MIPLEDNFTDIIGKAQRGLGISDSQLAEKARVSVDKIRKLRDGKVDDEALKRVAPEPESRRVDALWIWPGHSGNRENKVDRGSRAIQYPLSAI